jgi:hypothetical protein
MHTPMSLSTKAEPMLPSIDLLSNDSTRVLDATIADARVCYAQERVDFHAYFRVETLPELQRVLRGEQKETRGHKTRDEVVRRLLQAQRRSPHALWTLLLVQAFESTLVRRRRERTTRVDTAVDARIVGTFVDALVNLPYMFSPRELVTFVTRLSAHRLAGATEHASEVPPPPLSGVRVVAPKEVG